MKLFKPSWVGCLPYFSGPGYPPHNGREALVKEANEETIIIFSNGHRPAYAVESEGRVLSQKLVASPIFKYAAAAGFVGLAALMGLSLNKVLQVQCLYASFFLAVLAGAAFGGWKPGCLVIILSVLLVNRSFISSGGSNAFDADLPAKLIIFLAVSAVIVGVVEMQRMTQRRSDALVRQLQLEIERQEQTEIQLAASEERYRSLFENNLDAVFTLDTEGFFMTANPSALKLCGYSLEELQKVRFTGLCSPDQWTEAGRHFQLALQGTPEPFFEVPIITKEGRRVDLFITGGSIKLKGKTVGIFAIAADVTERKRLQTRLAAFSQVGQRLSSVTTPIAAGRIIGDVADELFGWDLFSLNLYSVESNQTDYVLNVDTFDGQKTEILPFLSAPGIPALAHRIIAHGAELVIDPSMLPGDAVPAKGARRSDSMMFVPINDKEKTIGVLSVGKCKPDAYDEQDLKTLLALADYCGGALQRIRAEAGWHRNEQDYRALFDSDGSGKCQVDPRTGKILRVNPKFCELTGYSSHELMEKTVREITHPDDREVSGQNFERLRRSEIHEFRMEKRYERKDKSVVWVDTTVTLVHDPEGQPARVITSSVDITARVQAESALHESENRFTSFMQHLSAPAWMKDLEGRYLYVNAACANVIRQSPESILGRTDADLFPSEIARAFVRNDRRVLTSGKALQTLETFHEQDGLHYSVINKFPILDKNGGAQIVGGIAMDVTERKAAENALVVSNQRLNLIAQVTNAVVGDEPLAEQMRNVVKTVRDAYAVKACIIRVMEGEELALLAYAGMEPGALAPRVPVNCAISREILKRAGPLFIPNLRAFVPDPSSPPEPANAAGFVSYAGAPLLAQDKIIGVVGIYTEQPMADFGDTDLQHLQIIANHIAVAIANNRLYREIKLQKSFLEEQIREREQAEDEVQK
ncbi:MAG TPA: PAS domain S-box protein, partial [Verrucomicrobiae bacterium]|nr:PAS domain S-box protein [Verrucomicrobiae bacterium]